MASSILRLPEIILLVLEHADLPSISALARTSKHIYQVILAYEVSISAGLLRSYLMPPIRSILSTRHAGRQRILRRMSLDAVQEVQRRHQRISALVRSEFLAVNTTIPDELRSQYLCCLKHAADLCDHISDFGCLCINDGPRPDHRVRQAQADFIKTLSAVELAFLSELSWVGSIGWVRSRSTIINGGDPDAKYESLAFEELVLRQGSSFLWGYALGPSEFRTCAEEKVACGVSEIQDWEVGIGHELPSLRQTVIRAFMAHKGCEFKDVWSELDAVIARCRWESSL